MHARFDHEPCPPRICPTNRVARLHEPEQSARRSKPLEPLRLEKAKTGVTNNKATLLENVHDRIERILAQNVESCVGQDVAM